MIQVSLFQRTTKIHVPLMKESLQYLHIQTHSDIHILVQLLVQFPLVLLSRLLYHLIHVIIPDLV